MSTLVVPPQTGPQKALRAPLARPHARSLFGCVARVDVVRTHLRPFSAPARAYHRARIKRKGAPASTGPRPGAWSDWLESNVHDDAVPRAHTQAGKCRRWTGSPDWYQAEARLTLGVGIHHWIVGSCNTRYCLNPGHLDARAPEPLDYPDGVCVYCGLASDTVDHLLPASWTGASARKYVLTVPACRECNAIINDRYAPAINERRDLAHAGIYRRHRRWLTVADNIDDVIEGLGPNLRSAVVAQVDHGDLTRDRLAWPGDEHYDLGACIRAGITEPYEIGLLTDTPPVSYVDDDYVPISQRPAGAPVVRQRAFCDSGCTCSTCARLSPSDKRRDQRTVIDGRLVHPRPPGGHGSKAAYDYSGCRCRRCCDARIARRDALRQRELEPHARRLARYGGRWLPAVRSSRWHFVVADGSNELTCRSRRPVREPFLNEEPADERCGNCTRRIADLSRLPLTPDWIPAPHRPSQGLLDLWFNGRGVPDGIPVQAKQRRRVAA